MPQFRTRKDGRHYPLKSKNSYPVIPSEARLTSLVKEEKATSKEYASYGWDEQSKQESNHSKFIAKVKNKLYEDKFIYRYVAGDYLKINKNNGKVTVISKEEYLRKIGEK